MESQRRHVVAGWASVDDGTKGPPIWDVVARHIEARKTVTAGEGGAVRILGN